MLSLKPRPSDQQIIAAIEPTPLVQKALGDLATRNAEQRLVIVQRLAAVEKDAERNAPKLAKDLAEATTELRRAEAALLAAARKVHAAQSAKSSAGFAFGREHDELEHQLVLGAAPELAAFIREVSDELNNPPQPNVIDTQVSRNAVTGRREKVEVTNLESIYSRLKALRAAAEKAKLMQLDADQSDVSERLARLRSSLPSIT